MTRRQQIAQLLRAGAYSAEDIARLVNAPFKQIEADLAHVRRGLKPHERWIVHSSECLACGFLFEGRERLNVPSRCPQCRKEEIREPAFEIGESES